MPVLIQTARVFIQDPIHANAIGDIYLAEDPAQIAKNGHLFIMINISNPEPEYEQFISSFIEKLENIYYYSVLEDSTKLLENSLNEINKWLPDNLPNSKKILRDLNIAVGNVKDNIINIAYIGDWQCYLLHKLKETEIFSKDNNAINPAKVFQNVITGNLNEGLSLIVSNPSLFDYIAKDKIRKITTTLPAKSAAEQLKNLVVEVPNSVSFLSILIKKPSSNDPVENETERFSTVKPRQTPEASTAELNRALANPVTKSRESLDNLISTQKKTQEIMSVSSLWKNLKSSTSDATKILKNKNINNQLGKFVKKTGIILGKGFISLGKGLGFLLLKSKNIFVHIVNPNKRIINRRTLSPVTGWLNMSLKNKLTLVAIIVLVIALSVIIFYPGESVPKLSQEQITSIKTNFDAQAETIEAALIYGDRIRAQQTLEQMRSELEAIPEQQQGPLINEMRQQITVLTERIWNIRHIDDPIVLFDRADNQELGQYKTVSATGDRVAVFTDNNKYLIYNFSDKDGSIANLPTEETEVKLSTLSPAQNILAFAVDNSLYLLQNDQLQEVNIPISAGLKNIAAATSFFNRLYLLDNETDQLYRHRASGNNFQSPDLWLRDNIDLADATGLAIDGFVYILRNNEVLKFTAGRQEPFPSIDIYPPLNKGTKLFTDANSENIYILDPENQRVIVLDKEGELQSQYHSDDFTNLQDFAVQEEADRLFLISDTKLFVLPL